jgi:biotin-(acetyl-CoA carboxylase) ligase
VSWRSGKSWRSREGGREFHELVIEFHSVQEKLNYLSRHVAVVVVAAVAIAVAAVVVVPAAAAVVVVSMATSK